MNTDRKIEDIILITADDIYARREETGDSMMQCKHQIMMERAKLAIEASQTIDDLKLSLMVLHAVIEATRNNI